MPIKRSNGTWIETIKAPNHKYYTWDWFTMTTAQIQTAINQGKISTQIIDENSPYQYTQYISNNANIRVVQNGYNVALVIEEFRQTTTQADEILTVKRSNGTVIYHKNHVWTTYDYTFNLLLGRTRQHVYLRVQEPLPFDVTCLVRINSSALPTGDILTDALINNWANRSWNLTLTAGNTEAYDYSDFWAGTPVITKVVVRINSSYTPHLTSGSDGKDWNNSSGWAHHTNGIDWYIT